MSKKIISIELSPQEYQVAEETAILHGYSVEDLFRNILHVDRNLKSQLLENYRHQLTAQHFSNEFECRLDDDTMHLLERYKKQIDNLEGYLSKAITSIIKLERSIHEKAFPLDIALLQRQLEAIKDAILLCDDKQKELKKAQTSLTRSMETIHLYVKKCKCI